MTKTALDTPEEEPRFSYPYPYYYTTTMTSGTVTMSVPTTTLYITPVTLSTYGNGKQEGTC